MRNGISKWNRLADEAKGREELKKDIIRPGRIVLACTFA
jgi:hypothetical protein